MTILLNGQSHEIDAAITIEQLLTKLEMAGKPVVVELNRQALLPREYATTTVSDGAEVEIITIAAGG